MAVQVVRVSSRPSAWRTEAGSGPVAIFVTAFSPRLAAAVGAVPPSPGDIAEIGPQPNSGHLMADIQVLLLKWLSAAGQAGRRRAAAPTGLPASVPTAAT